MKSIVSLLSVTVTVLTAHVALAQPAKEIVKDFLDENVLIVVPVATNRVTTISFPSAITAIDGAGVTVDGKTPGLFQLAHTKGSAFLSVRALFPKASANLNIRWNEHTYVFELTESDHPVLSLNLEAPPTPEEAGVGHAPQVSPLKLLALLDKAKVFPLLKVQQPESVANVDFTTYDGKPLVSDFNDYEIQIEEAFRFNAEDTLVFRLVITNKVDAPLIYQPDSFILRAGNRLYPQSISDGDGTVPPKGRSIVYFAVSGTPDGGRNELSLRNAFTVLVTRLSPPPPPPVVTVTNAPSVHPIRSPWTNHETARLSQFLQNQERQARCLWRSVRRRADHFQRRSQTSHVRRRCGQRYGTGYQCHGQTAGGAVCCATDAGF